MNATEAWIVLVWVVGIVGYPGILMVLSLGVYTKVALFAMVFFTQPPPLVGQADFTVCLHPWYTGIADKDGGGPAMCSTRNPTRWRPSQPAPQDPPPSLAAVEHR